MVRLDPQHSHQRVVQRQQPVFAHSREMTLLDMHPRSCSLWRIGVAVNNRGIHGHQSGRLEVHHRGRSSDRLGRSSVRAAPCNREMMIAARRTRIRPDGLPVYGYEPRPSIPPVGTVTCATPSTAASYSPASHTHEFFLVVYFEGEGGALHIRSA